jgi:hypothetical protein
VPRRSETRAPSTESLLSILVRLVRRGLHRGMQFDLTIGLHPEHPCHEEERSSTSSRPTTFDFAGRRASPSLSARLGHGVKMPRLRFYNQRSRHEHSISTPPLETDQAGRSRGRRGVATSPPGVDAGPPRGHPASSGCMLDGTLAGFGSIDGRADAFAPCGRAPALFRLTGRPVDRHPLVPPSGGWSWSR